MSECARIADQLRRALDGAAWHGPALRELLKGVSAATAAARPIPDVHSIWEIVLHISAWTEAVRRRLLGERAELSPEEDWPAVGEASAAAWGTAQERLGQAQERLLEELGRVPAERLDAPIVQGMPSVYVTLHGLVQHHLYHAGQIAVLKKAAGLR
jgi:uncharacterized damage-inducible protein DinB